MPDRKPLILGAAIGECVHVAGVMNFLWLAEEQGYDTHFLGPAVSVSELIGAALESDPEIVACGYRLTPDNAAPLFDELQSAVEKAGLTSKRFIFGGPKLVADVAARTGFFEKSFSGLEPVEEIIAYLRGHDPETKKDAYPNTLVDRVASKKPFPVIRHHFGLPSVHETVDGCRRIAEAEVLDVISIATDQTAQEHFFRPEEIREENAGAGGVPVRRADDLRKIYDAAQTGNYPLLRCYSGTQDTVRWAEMLQQTIRNAWCAIPLTWYSVLDGRGPRPLDQTIRESQQLMAWHGARGIPVESNESHHWSLRDAPDSVAVVMAFLAAYSAKKAGVRHYVAQYMLNTPPGTSGVMDLGKMMAKQTLIGELEDETYSVFTQVRPGLSSFPVNMEEAKGHLAWSVGLGMGLKPDIVHVVAFTEADHAARPEDVIESCRIARRVIEKTLQGGPDPAADPRVTQRRDELVGEARLLLNAIHELGTRRGAEDPWGDAGTITAAVELGLIDAAQLRNTPPARGEVVTRIVDGACRAVDPSTHEPLTEGERIRGLFVA